jgi:proteasome assembly chaperone (PAC2) family protein
MSDAVDIWEIPQSEKIYMLLGWRQWADAGSVSSNLPGYLTQQTNARHIGTIKPDGFYMFQIPGTHGLVRPVVKFDQGFPENLEERRNDIYYTGDERRGIVILVGDEPHLDVERYVAAILEVADRLKVARIISLAGVYGELPYTKERMISCIYSQPHLKDELNAFGVTYSDYNGGASIGSYICRRAADANREFIGFYAMVPTYDFSQLAQATNGIRIENDFMAWHGIMRRINYMLKTTFDLTDLESKSKHLIQVIDAKVDEIDREMPELNIRAYLGQLEADFDETEFDPLDSVWENELRRLLDDDAEES